MSEVKSDDRKDVLSAYCVPAGHWPGVFEVPATSPLVLSRLWQAPVGSLRDVNGVPGRRNERVRYSGADGLGEQQGATGHPGDSFPLPDLGLGGREQGREQGLESDGVGQEAEERPARMSTP